jgi:hypothetical protein
MTSNKTKAPSEPLYKAMIAAGVDYRPWESQGLDDDECFVCTKTIGDGERTTEDVIPGWILRKLRKRGMQLLPNLTQIPVNKILLPTCQSCNGGHLSRIEKEVAAAFKAGPAAVAALPERTLRMWCTKIAYGSRRRDLQLATDRTNPASPNLASKEDLEAFRLRQASQGLQACDLRFLELAPGLEPGTCCLQDSCAAGCATPAGGGQGNATRALGRENGGGGPRTRRGRRPPRR